MKKLIALLMTILMLSSVTVATAGCKKDKTLGDGDDVVIQFQLDNLGYGTQWLVESCDRFMEQQKDVEYPGGKKGVYCHIVRGNTPTANNVNQTATHVVFKGGTGDTLAETGNVWDLTEVVRNMEIPGEPGVTIEDKYYEESLAYYLAGETYNSDGTLDKTSGSYYSIPTHEMYAGFSYDKTVFDSYGFYFARRTDGDEVSTGNSDFSYQDYEDEYGVIPYYSELIGTVCYFVEAKPETAVEGWEEGKSCGPNGIYGDYDDGLPSSLYELISLWAYIKSSNSVNPVLVSGFQQSLSNAILDSLPSALMGYDKARAQLDLEGPTDAVVNFQGSITDGLQYIEAPIVQSVEVTEQTGYYTTWAVERYFTMATMEILVAEGFLDPSSYPGTSAELNHLGAQKKFIDSGYQTTQGQGQEVAMLMEYSYWWNESTIRGNLSAFNALNKNVDREIRWMPLPVNIATSVTGENETVEYKWATEPGVSFSHTGTNYVESKLGEKNLLVQAGNAGLFVSKKAVEASEAEKQAVIDWLLFFHSDSELSKVTASQGFRKSLKYEMQAADTTNWASFYRDLYELSEVSTIIRHSAENETFNENVSTLFSRSEGNLAWQCSHSHYFACYRNTPSAAQDRSSRRCFIHIMVTKKEWENYYKGGKNLDEIEALYYDEDKTKEILFVDYDDSKPV